MFVSLLAVLGLSCGSRWPKVSLVRPLFVWYQACPVDLISRRETCNHIAFSVVPGLSCWSLVLMICLDDHSTRWYQACPVDQLLVSSPVSLCLFCGARLDLLIT